MDSNDQDDLVHAHAEESAETSGEDLPLIELERLLARPPSKRKRLMQMGVVIALLGVAALTLRSVILPAPVVPPPPTPTVFVSSPSLVIESNLTFGTLIINGKRQSGPAPFLAAVHGDAYAITLEAPPFRPVSCQFTLSRLPTADYFPSGACSGLKARSSDGLGVMTIQGVTGFPTYALFLAVTMDDLPPAQQHQVTNLLQQVLSTRQEISVPAQAAIATRAAVDGTVLSQRLETPLQATASVSLWPPQLSLPAPDCPEQICPVESGPQFMGELSGSVWGISVPLALRWQFAMPSGVLVSDVTFPTAVYVVPFLFYATKTGWQVTKEAQVMAPALTTELEGAICQVGMQLALLQLGKGWQPDGVYDHGVNGCRLIFLRQQDASPALFSALVLWRFGVLLALDNGTHQLLPTLPVASADDILAVGG
jgi:hypothetical protein